MYFSIRKFNFLEGTRFPLSFFFFFFFQILNYQRGFYSLLEIFLTVGLVKQLFTMPLNFNTNGCTLSRKMHAGKVIF